MTLPELNEVDFNGGGEIIGKTPLRSEEIEIEFNGGGSVQLELYAGELDLDFNGSITASLSGEVGESVMVFNGSHVLKAFDMTTRKAKINVNGSGTTEVNVTDVLDVKIRGSGNLSYRGKIKDMEITILGSGKVIGQN